MSALCRRELDYLDKAEKCTLLQRAGIVGRSGPKGALTMEAHLAIPCMDAIAAGGSHSPACVKELNTDHLMQLKCVYPIAQRECIGCTTLHAQVLVHSTSFDSTSAKKNKTSVNRNNGVRDKSSFFCFYFGRKNCS